MTQNKSVEEVVEDFRHTFKGCDQCNLGNGQGDWIEDFIRTAIQQERQTSQEREREIVVAYLQKYLDDAYWAISEGDLQDIIKNLTNPNKD